MLKMGARFSSKVAPGKDRWLCGGRALRKQASFGLESAAVDVRDEKSMVRWRTTRVHHIIQKQGRAEIFEDYHLRIGDVTADTDAPSSASVHEQRFDETKIGAKFATIAELTRRQGTSFDPQIDIVADLGLDISEAMIDHHAFASIYNPGKLALLAL
ncbi:MULTISPECIES: hypothetical protein [Bradyrhizobium]|uniref:hypothetical protein n=1 Tax=Bradyrhizobium elkanii TaxID=29448 RepID=UPI0012BBB059|nr:hypothetical protein [Bradyrhizobium elkanii]